MSSLAAGPWTPGLLEASGLIDRASGPPLIEPVRGQILSLEGPLPGIRQIVWGEGVYLVPKRDGSWVVGATEESVGFDRRVTAEGVAWLLDGARRIFPELAQASFGRAWAGLRPVSRDRFALDRRSSGMARALPGGGAWAQRRPARADHRRIDSGRNPGQERHALFAALQGLAIGGSRSDPSGDASTDLGTVSLTPNPLRNTWTGSISGAGFRREAPRNRRGVDRAD